MTNIVDLNGRPVDEDALDVWTGTRGIPEAPMLSMDHYDEPYIPVQITVTTKSPPLMTFQSVLLCIAVVVVILGVSL